MKRGAGKTNMEKTLNHLLSLSIRHHHRTSNGIQEDTAESVNVSRLAPAARWVCHAKPVGRWLCTDTGFNEF